MKTPKLAIAVTLLCVNALLLAVCQAAEQSDKAGTSSKAAITAPSTQTRAAVSPAAKDADMIMLTGSYIPQKIKRVSRITDGPLNVIVIDRSQISGSGAGDLAGVLAREPGIRIRHE